MIERKSYSGDLNQQFDSIRPYDGYKKKHYSHQQIYPKFKRKKTKS